MHVSRGYFGSWLITTHSPLNCFYPRAASILIHTYFLWKAVKVLSLCHLELNDVHNFPLTKGEKKSSFYTKRTHKELKIKSWWNNFQIKKNIKTYILSSYGTGSCVDLMACQSFSLDCMHLEAGRVSANSEPSLPSLPAVQTGNKHLSFAKQRKRPSLSSAEYYLLSFTISYSHTRI